MDVFRQLVQALNSVKNPLTLIAFLIVCGIAALIYVLKSTNGLMAAQQLLLRNSSLKPGEFVRLVNGVLFCLFALAAMLFVFLGYSSYTEHKAGTQDLRNQIMVLKNSLPCYGDSCTGKEPQKLGCSIPSMTQTIGLLEGSLELDGKTTSANIDLRYSPLCQAIWVKTTQIAGTSIWFESAAGEKMVEYTLPKTNSQADAHTDMVSAGIKGRGCLQAPQQKAICTSLVEPHNLLK